MNLLELAHNPILSAKAAKLRYVTDAKPGIIRQPEPDGTFTYILPDGQRVDDNTLSRIRVMALPPAWQNVWTCALPNGHLQATGTDTKGRKQYRYHAKWNAIRAETKFFRVIAFGEKLPLLRARIDKALKQRDLNQEKVLALALSVMEQTLIRVGNAAYEKEYGSYGLTTLKDDHVTATGSAVKFSFVGKKGIQHSITLRDTTISQTRESLSGH